MAALDAKLKALTQSVGFMCTLHYDGDLDRWQSATTLYNHAGWRPFASPFPGVTLDGSAASDYPGLRCGTPLTSKDRIFV